MLNDEQTNNKYDKNIQYTNKLIDHCDFYSIEINLVYEVFNRN